MKVVLLQDVKKVGRRHEIKDVPDGLARNLLIPQKKAVPATPDAIAKAKQVQEVKVAREERAQSDLHDTLAKLRESSITIAAPANGQGNLFKGIRAEDIAAYISKEIGPIDAASIALKFPIKETGTHAVEVSGHGEKGEIIINIEAA